MCVGGWAGEGNFLFNSKKGSSLLLGSHIINQLITSSVYFIFSLETKLNKSLLVVKLEEKNNNTFQKLLEMGVIVWGDRRRFVALNLD